jgi:hypothetical protein
VGTLVWGRCNTEYFSIHFEPHAQNIGERYKLLKQKWFSLTKARVIVIPLIGIHKSPIGWMKGIIKRTCICMWPHT